MSRFLSSSADNNQDRETQKSGKGPDVVALQRGEEDRRRRGTEERCHQGQMCRVVPEDVRPSERPPRVE